MVITKEQIQKQIDAMPDQFDTEELMERIYIVSKIERGLQDIREGNVYTQEEVRKEMAKWLRSGENKATRTFPRFRKNSSGNR